MIKEFMNEGILCISKGDNPKIIEQKPNAYLPTQSKEISFKGA